VICFLRLVLLENSMLVLTFKTGMLILLLKISNSDGFCVQNEGPACVPAPNPDNGPGDVYPFPSGDLTIGVLILEERLKDRKKTFVAPSYTSPRRP
jgi:hypothetical protein